MGVDDCDGTGSGVEDIKWGIDGTSTSCLFTRWWPMKQCLTYSLLHFFLYDVVAFQNVINICWHLRMSFFIWVLFFKSFMASSIDAKACAICFAWKCSSLVSSLAWASKTSVMSRFFRSIPSFLIVVINLPRTQSYSSWTFSNLKSY